MLSTQSHSRGTRIEVSGWDENEVFFVERSQFSYDEFSGKHITLKNNVADGALIFLRLIHSAVAPHSAPIPYQAKFIGFDDLGAYQFSLVPAHALYPASRYPVN